MVIALKEKEEKMTVICLFSRHAESQQKHLAERTVSKWNASSNPDHANVPATVPGRRECPPPQLFLCPPPLLLIASVVLISRSWGQGSTSCFLVEEEMDCVSSWFLYPCWPPPTSFLCSDRPCFATISFWLSTVHSPLNYNCCKKNIYKNMGENIFKI